MNEIILVSDNELINHLFKLINPDDWLKLSEKEKQNTIDVLLSNPGELLTPDMVDTHLEKGSIQDSLGPTSSSLSNDAINGLDQIFSDLIRLAEHKMYAYYEGKPAVIGRNGMYTISCPVESDHPGMAVVNRYVIAYDPDGHLFERLSMHKSERSFVEVELVMQRSKDTQDDVLAVKEKTRPNDDENINPNDGGDAIMED